jgi:hypothetical protein
MTKHKKDKSKSNTERENDGSNPETLGEKETPEAPLSPIISFSETAIAKKRRQEEAMEEEARRKKLRKNAPSRSTLPIPDVAGSDSGKDEDSDENHEEGDDDDSGKHKRGVRSDSHVSASSGVADKQSVLDRLRVLLASSEEEGEELDQDELLQNLTAIINPSQSLAFISSQQATDSHLKQLLAALNKAPHNATLVASDDLPNKCMTYPLSMGKIKAYFNRVRALKNSDHPYTENRTQFDEDIEGMIDLWWLSSKEGTDKPKEWQDIKTLNAREFQIFLERKVSEAAPSHEQEVDFELKRFISQGLAFNPANPQAFLYQLGKVRNLLTRIPDKDLGRDTHRGLREYLRKHLKIMIGGIESKEALEQFWLSLGQVGTSDFGQLLVAITTAVDHINSCIKTAKIYLPKSNASFKAANTADQAASKKQNQTPSSKPTSASSSGQQQAALCRYCGNTHSGECRLKDARHSNKEAVPWSESTQGRHFLALGYKTCPRNPDPPKRDSQTTYYSKNKSEYLLALNTKQNELTMSLLLSQGDYEEIKVFLDTGATSNNYVSSRIGDLIRLSSNSQEKYCSSDSRIVCCAFSKYANDVAVKLI